MRFPALLITLILVLPLMTCAQQSLPPAQQDVQGVDVVSQALNAVGGIPAIKAIEDYTATGSITYHLAHDTMGSVTVRGRGLDQLRIDARLPAGTRSRAIGRGLNTMKFEDGTVTGLGIQAPLAPTRLILPFLFLASVLNSPGYILSYKGITQLDDHSVHQIQVQPAFLGAATESDQNLRDYLTINFFVDTSTFRIVMIQDSIPNHANHQIRYSDYRLVDGIQVPFSIVDSGGEQPSVILLNSISFNLRLQESDFQF